MTQPHRTSFLRSRMREIDRPSPERLAERKTCPMCQREFEPKRSQRLDHCSSACARLAKQRRAIGLDNGELQA